MAVLILILGCCLESVVKNTDVTVATFKEPDYCNPKAESSYLVRRRLCRSFGSVRQMAPALDGFAAGHLVDVLLEHGQQFFHSVHNQLVQSGDDQVVNETDEAVRTKEKVCFVSSFSPTQNTVSQTILSPAAAVASN